MRYNYYDEYDEGEECYEGSVRCKNCGVKIDEGEPYVQSDGGNICASCADEMDIFEILSLLEFDSVIELIEAASNKVRYK